MSNELAKQWARIRDLNDIWNGHIPVGYQFTIPLVGVVTVENEQLPGIYAVTLPGGETDRLTYEFIVDIVTK